MSKNNDTNLESNSPTTPQNKSAEQVHRFFFDDSNARGELVTLEKSFHEATQHQNNHPVANQLLGEFLVAVSLLSGVLKYKGVLVLQARGEGPIPLVMAEATDDRKIRGIIRTSNDSELDKLKGETIANLIGKGILSITIDPEKGQRYQGIVALEGDSLADCLGNYFKQSEQLPTKLWIEADSTNAAGMLLQALPAQVDEDAEESWSQVYVPASTIKPEELLKLDHETILYRLFNELQTRIAEASTVEFRCSCSRERSLNALNSLSAEEVAGLIAQQGQIDIDCQFCGRHYVFEEKDLSSLNNKPKNIH